MKISIIVWDACFRESHHAIDFFCQQDYPIEDFEFIWVDFYKNENPTLLKKISNYPNARILNLNNPRSILWHLGKCVNAGIKESKGELLIIPDGDIAAPNNLLAAIEKDISKIPDLVLYFRRFDEPEYCHNKKKSYNIDYLREVCSYTHVNYGGMIGTAKSTLKKVNNYETEACFSGGGASGFDLYIRLANAGFPIKWHSEYIFHPFHKETGSLHSFYAKKEVKDRLFMQRHVITQRTLNISFLADEHEVQKYISTAPKRKYFYSYLLRNIYNKVYVKLKKLIYSKVYLGV